MIIAFPLQDITTRDKSGKPKTLQKKGRAIRLINFHGNMAILENATGERFPANISRLVYYDTLDKGPALVF